MTGEARTAPRTDRPGRRWRDLVLKIGVYGRMVKFSHTVFALPFALSALVLAGREHRVTLVEIFWILVAMVGARSAAMGFNRIVDAGFDARNPRTAARELPAGRLSGSAAGVFVVCFSGIFVFAAAMLGPLPLMLSGPVLGVLFLYSYTKRFTWLAHLYLGFAIALAPPATWIAVTGVFSGKILWLSVALAAYIAGFDILYACQDVAFDRSQGLFSIPARFGVKPALRAARAIHAAAYGAFMMLYFAFDMTGGFLLAVGLIGFLLIFEHWLTDPDDLSRVPIAFFHVNSVISVTLLAGVLADELIRRMG
ncbi:UbiA-like polyprenyltransferase [Desulfococcus multivorans]|uniref:4-hydroxybenzoate polyprenyltransferase n=1 Tax=Desulfococcus multivorans DSM 2059 TaxID=1121405 RepID=S7VJ49_DESML|nr:UbiA-like polyprenyltransferase [Desulfococcus multivorans]AOY60207.1 UbiA2: 4-hydroxybenzoate polyprenyltransferase [Desulfococcus multivorans]AQV02329.1 4-hydroxybenzoate octaprenyltransferase [Desulfococcus multivorans]EPR44598.1 4-hydroxybenzoate polyprenyltransferase [Desulfococcus multivorans DSM 2059]SKA06808.1 4-hydroxybenzoate polyprenyltransferase [Desulfococcus multivorans DSM 2059]